jgi:hypothetical protein
MLAEYTQICMKDPNCCTEDFVQALGAKLRHFPPSSLVISDLHNRAGIVRKMDNVHG